MLSLLLLLRRDQRPLSSLYEEGFRSLFENEVDTLPRKEVVVRRIRHMMGANTRKASAAQHGPVTAAAAVAALL